jgi:filamentous hemagglutinin family protein
MNTLQRNPSASRPARGPRSRPRRLALALALAGIAAHTLLPAGREARAQTLPSGMAVVRGQAAVNVNGNRMTVTNSTDAVLNWQSFSIGSGQSVRFDQPSSSSRVLNRVVGSDPSSIFGSLSSNGEVWLLNPYGVLFGAGARVDVASLVVSTLNIGSDDWRARNLHFTAGGGSPEAAIVNQGELRSSAGGRVMLLGGAGGVRNEGLISAPDGQVVLAAGQSVDLADTTAGNLAVRVTAPQGTALNLGSLAAGGGRVELWAAMVNQQGIVRADALSAGGAGGQVVLQGNEGVQLGAGSVTSASGASGGNITVDAGAGTALLSGSVAATGSSGAGGDIRLLGRQVGLLDGSLTDASGAAGGGQVLAGGGRQGQDASVPNAQALYMGPRASVLADATGQGDGGSIVLWSDSATRAYGSLSARGGPLGGDGGFIETSGGWLDANPASVRTDAPRGRAGQWLLDPNNIFIVDGGNDANVTTGPTFDTTGDSAVVTTGSIISALGSGNNVIVRTGTAGNNSQAGDIVMFGGNIVTALDGDVSLTLDAARNISLQSSTIQAIGTGGGLSLVLSAARSGVGTISLANTTVSTAGGSITLGGTAQASGQYGNSPFAGAVGYNGNSIGVSISGSRLDAGNGDITIAGQSVAQVGGGSGLVQGVSINSGSTLDGHRIAIQGWVDSDANLDRTGVVIEAGTRVTATASLDITGTVLSAIASSQPLTGVRIGGTAAVSNGIPFSGSHLMISGLLDDTITTQSDAKGLQLLPNATIDASGAESASLSGTRQVSLGDYSNYATLNTSSGGPTSVTALGTGARIDTRNLDITGTASDFSFNADTVAGYHYVNLFGSNSSFTVNAGDYLPDYYSTVQATGPISLLADRITFQFGVSFSSSASGDAIVVAGRSGNNLQFDNQAGSNVFSTESGRWLFYGTDPRNSTDYNFGGLVHDAVVYGVSYGDFFDAGAQNDSGRLLLFSVLPSLSAATGTPISRVYDGTLAIDPTDSGQVAGLINGDRIAGTFASKNVGSGLAITLFSNASEPIVSTISDAQGKPVYGYSVEQAFTLSGDITPRPLTVGSVSANGKTYDGNTSVSFGSVSLSNLVGSETLGVQVSGSFTNPNAGSGRTVTGALVLQDGSNGGLASNYSLSGGGAFSTSADIAQKTLSLSGLSVTGKTYDGLRTASVSGGSLSGLVGNETLGFSASALFDTKDAGTGKTVTGSVSLLDGTGLAANYTLGSAAAFSGTADIAQRSLTLAGVSAAGKTYDGTRTVSLSGGTLSNLVGSETLTLSLSGLFDDANAGGSKAVSGSATLADGSGLAANYSLSNPSFTASAGIAQRLLTLAGVTAANKTYDGLLTAALSGGTLSNLVGNETLGLSLSGQFATKDAGTGKTVNASAALADGTGLASNYTLGSGAGFVLSANVLQRAVTVSGVTAADKVYDGSTAATLGGGALNNLVGGETLGLVFSAGQFSDKNAGTGKTVSGSVTLADASGLASNYTLGNSAAVSASASILQRTLSLSGVTAASKTYDGTVAATLGGGVLANLVGTETLGMSFSGGQFDTKDAGTAKAVSGNAALADGSGLAANYVLASNTVGTSADITPKALTVSGFTAANKTYDGTRSASASGGTLIGLVGSETLVLSLAGVQFDTANAGIGKTVSGNATLADGSGLAANYTLPGGQVSATADILRKSLTLSGVTASNKTYDGSTAATLTGGSLSGLVGSETLALNLSGQFANPNAGTAKPVTGTAALGDGSGLAGNYVLGNANLSATADIAPKALTLSGVTAAGKTYDATTAVTLGGGVLGGLVGNESLGLVLSGAFVNKDAGSGKAVTGSAVLADGSGLAANYTLPSPGFVTAADIARRGLSVVGASAADKVYDGGTQALISGWLLGGVISGDQVSVAAGSGSFARAGVGTAVAVTATAASLAGSDAGNYLLSQPSFVTAAAVLPATLSYVATPVSASSGNALPTLTGSVSGFVAGETLASATGGSLLFSTQATASSPPGAYAVTGSGLTAANYVFVQAPGNANALILLGGSTVPSEPVLPLPVESMHIASVLPPPVVGSSVQTRTADATQALSLDASGSASGFGAIDIGGLSQGALAELLQARRRYMASVLGDATRRLEADPTLADLPACETPAQIDTGTCLVTEELLARLQGDAGTEAAVTLPAAPGAAPMPPVAAAPAPAPTTVALAPLPTPAAAPVTAPVVIAPKLSLSAAPRRQVANPTMFAPPLPAPRPVRQASLPQIQRKLALLISEDNYVDDRIPDLDNAGRDVQGVAEVLRTRLGYETVVVTDASRQAIIGSLNKLALAVRPSDSVLIYYAGHGTVVDGTQLGYWIPANADAAKPETWVSNNDIDRLIGRIRAQQVVLISDSCFSGSLVGDTRVLRAGEQTGDARLFLGKRAAVVMSSGGNEPVADGNQGGHSPFASSLMKNLSEVPSWRIGSSVFENVRAEVSLKLPQQPQYGTARLGRHALGADYVFEQRQLGAP